MIEIGGKRMKNDKRLWEICKEIYRKMYEESEPKGEFIDIEKKNLGFYELLPVRRKTDSDSRRNDEGIQMH